MSESTTLPEELVIEAGRADRHYWRDLWRYRELLGFLSWRDIKVRYQQTVLGVAWAVIQPGIQTLLLTFVFSTLANVPNTGAPHWLVTLCGLLAWGLFANAFNGAGNSLVGNAHLISKVYFPRLVVPIASLAVALIDLAILLTIALIAAFATGYLPSWRLLLLPLFILLGLVIALGAGLWIGALTVKFRDFRFISPLILQIGIFVTPVGYQSDFYPNWKTWLYLNPLTAVVEGFRWCILRGENQLTAESLTISVASALALASSGLWFFRRTERGFADNI